MSKWTLNIAVNLSLIWDTNSRTQDHMNRCQRGFQWLREVRIHRVLTKNQNQDGKYNFWCPVTLDLNLISILYFLCDWLNLSEIIFLIYALQVIVLILLNHCPQFNNPFLHPQLAMAPSWVEQTSLPFAFILVTWLFGQWYMNGSAIHMRWMDSG